MKTTIIDVAREAGVSISTVSNALNGKKNVSPQLREKIVSAVEKLGYKADIAASSLKTKATKVIGLIVPSIDSAFFPAVIKGLQLKLEAAGYIINFYATGFRPELEENYVDAMIANRVDGIIIDSVSVNPSFLSSLAFKTCGKKHVPVIALERDLTIYSLTSVYVDNYRGGRLAAETLVSRGSKTPAHILGPMSAPWSIERYSGFCDRLSEFGLPFIRTYIGQGDFSLAGGYSAAKYLIQNAPGFDGLFAANDLTAIGAMKAFAEAGIAVPGNMPVIGFDNIAISQLTSPSVTTVDVPKQRLGEEAGTAVVKAIEGCSEIERIEIPLTVVERLSTGVTPNVFLPL